MLKSITKFSVSNPVTISMIILAVLLLGFISFDKLGIDLFPDLNNPRLYIEVKAGERPPEEMEDKFVDNIESVSIRQSGVVNVSSASRVGVSLIEVEYSWNKDMDEAFLDLSKALSGFNQNTDIDEINISQQDPNAKPVMLIALQHTESNDLNELRKISENYVRNELIRLEGIAEVEVDGSQDIEVLIETSDYLLKSYNIDLNLITSKIQNFNKSISGGSIVEMGRRYVVRGLSELERLDDIEEIILRTNSAINTENGEDIPVLLRDVADISFRGKDMDNAVFFNGKPCVGLSIYKEMKYNTVKAVEALNEALAKMEKSLPGYTFTIVEDQGKFVAGAIGEVRDSAIGGIVLAVFILLLFLRRIGPTLIVSTVIPVSIIATFSLMYFTDLTLNIMTLGGIALGAGMLVDNAIVVLENIFRYHEKGETARDAAILGTSQVGGAIIASTLTTIVVFVPIVYMHGASGELFREQAITVAFSLICSLVAAILIIPMLYSKFSKNGKQKIRNKKSVQIKAYGNFLNKILNHKTYIVAGAIILMASAWFMFKQVGSEFMPKSESNEFYIDLLMPEGTRLQRTAGAVENMEAIIEELSKGNLEHMYSEIGSTSGLSSNVSTIFDDQNRATIKVRLAKDHGDQSRAIIEALNNLYSGNDNLSLAFRQEETALQSILGTEESPVVIELIGNDMDILEGLTDTAIARLAIVEGLQNINTSIEGGAPEVEIEIDRYRAGLMGIDVATLVARIGEKLQGKNAGQMEVKGELKDITIKLKDLNLKQLENLAITVNNNEVLIKEVAKINIEASPREILHNNQNRVVKISADLAQEIPLDRMSNKIDVAMANMHFPTGYRYNVSGEEALRKDSMKNLSFALILSLILVYMVLAAQFESLVHPFTILLTIPVSVVGAIAVFYIQGSPLNIMSVIGIIMLVGIAVNDSIILVDAINQNRKEGMNLRQSIIDAGERRIRPIIMTTLTTILALIPLTLGFGESASLRSPMAWAVIGGLITSTILTLILIPCVYHIIGQIGNKRTKTA